LLRAAGLPPPVRQHEVVIGDRRYFLDFAYPDERVMIEIDGWEARGRRETFETDRARQNRLMLAGWTPLRFTARSLRERAHEVVATVATAVRCAS
jgi:very-short-patch-repair endonuclease